MRHIYIHLHNGIYSQPLKNEIMPFVICWDGLEVLFLMK